MILSVNGEQRTVEVDPETPLLWVLREQLDLTGPKYGCGIGQCGFCTVLFDGQPRQACQIPVREAAGAQIVTIEGLDGPLAERIKQAWVAEQVPQCGYCQPGQIIATHALLTENPSPTDQEINQKMNAILCRCGTYPEIRRAIHSLSVRGTNNE